MCFFGLHIFHCSSIEHNPCKLQMKSVIDLVKTNYKNQEFIISIKSSAVFQDTSKLFNFFFLAYIYCSREWLTSFSTIVPGISSIAQANKFVFFVDTSSIVAILNTIHVFCKLN